MLSTEAVTTVIAMLLPGNGGDDIHPVHKPTTHEVIQCIGIVGKTSSVMLTADSLGVFFLRVIVPESAVKSQIKFALPFIVAG